MDWLRSRKERLLKGTPSNNRVSLPGDEDGDPALYIPNEYQGRAGTGRMERVNIPWDSAEYSILSHAVALSLPWISIPPLLRKKGFLRTSEECSNKWKALLKKEWTAEEEELLLESHNQLRDGEKADWNRIADAMASKQFFRSPMCFKVRHARLVQVREVPSDSVKPSQVENTVRQAPEKTVSNGHSTENTALQVNCADAIRETETEPKEKDDGGNVRQRGWTMGDDDKLKKFVRKRELEKRQWADVSRWLQECGIYRTADSCRQRYKRLVVHGEAPPREEIVRNTELPVAQGRITKPKTGRPGRKGVDVGKNVGKENNIRGEKLRNKPSSDKQDSNAAIVSQDANAVRSNGGERQPVLTPKPHTSSCGEIETERTEKLKPSEEVERERSKPTNSPSDTEPKRIESTKVPTEISRTEKRKTALQTNFTKSSTANDLASPSQAETQDGQAKRPTDATNLEGNIPKHSPHPAEGQSKNAILSTEAVTTSKKSKLLKIPVQPPKTRQAKAKAKAGMLTKATENRKAVPILPAPPIKTRWENVSLSSGISGKTSAVPTRKAVRLMPALPANKEREMVLSTEAAGKPNAIPKRPASPEMRPQKTLPVDGSEKRKELSIKRAHPVTPREESNRLSTNIIQEQKDAPKQPTDPAKRRAERPGISSLVKKRSRASSVLADAPTKKSVIQPRSSNAAKKQNDNHAPTVGDDHVGQSHHETTVAPKSHGKPTGTRSNPPEKLTGTGKLVPESQKVANGGRMVDEESPKRQPAPLPATASKKQSNTPVDDRNAKESARTLQEKSQARESRQDTGMQAQRQHAVQTSARKAENRDTTHCISPVRKPEIEVINLVDDDDDDDDVDIIRPLQPPLDEVINVDEYSDDSSEDLSLLRASLPPRSAEPISLTGAPPKSSPASQLLRSAANLPVNAVPTSVPNTQTPAVHTSKQRWPSRNDDTPPVMRPSPSPGSMPALMQQAQSSAPSRQIIPPANSQSSLPSSRQTSSASTTQRRPRAVLLPSDDTTPVAHLSPPEVSFDPSVVARANKMRAWISDGYESLHPASAVAGSQTRTDAKLRATLQECPITRTMRNELDSKKGYDRFPDLLEGRPDAVEWTRGEDASLVSICRAAPGASWLEIAAMMKGRGHNRSSSAVQGRHDALRKMAGLAIASDRVLGVDDVQIREPVSSSERSPIVTQAESDPSGTERHVQATEGEAGDEVTAGIALAETQAEVRGRPRGRPRGRRRGRPLLVRERRPAPVTDASQDAVTGGRARGRRRGRPRGRPRGRGTGHGRWTVRKKRREPARWCAVEDNAVLKGAEEVCRGVKNWNGVVVDLEVLGYFRSAEECRLRARALQDRRKEGECDMYDELSNDGDSELSDASGGGELGEIG